MKCGLMIISKIIHFNSYIQSIDCGIYASQRGNLYCSFHASQVFGKSFFLYKLVAQYLVFRGTLYICDHLLPGTFILVSTMVWLHQISNMIVQQLSLDIHKLCSTLGHN